MHTNNSTRLCISSNLTGHWFSLVTVSRAWRTFLPSYSHLTRSVLKKEKKNRPRSPPIHSLVLDAGIHGSQPVDRLGLLLCAYRISPPPKKNIILRYTISEIACNFFACIMKTRYPLVPTDASSHLPAVHQGSPFWSQRLNISKVHRYISYVTRIQQHIPLQLPHFLTWLIDWGPLFKACLPSIWLILSSFYIIRTWSIEWIYITLFQLRNSSAAAASFCEPNGTLQSSPFLPCADCREASGLTVMHTI